MPSRGDAKLPLALQHVRHTCLVKFRQSGVPHSGQNFMPITNNLSPLPLRRSRPCLLHQYSKPCFFIIRNEEVPKDSLEQIDKHWKIEDPSSILWKLCGFYSSSSDIEDPTGIERWAARTSGSAASFAPASILSGSKSLHPRHLMFPHP